VAHAKPSLPESRLRQRRRAAWASIGRDDPFADDDRARCSRFPLRVSHGRSTVARQHFCAELITKGFFWNSRPSTLSSSTNFVFEQWIWPVAMQL
jgi:hypothetical protein